MSHGSRIKSVFAREIFSDRNHPGVEAIVETEDGSIGSAIATAGQSVGKHEIKFVYDGGERYSGLGVQKAARNVNDIIAKKIIGMDATNQRKVDEAMIELDDTEDKSKIGGNATASVSAAVLKAGAASLGIPLYQHIGGVNACIIPTPGTIAIAGSKRYGGGQRGGGKPSYALMTYGFDCFADASYACWKVQRTFHKNLNSLLTKRGFLTRIGGRNFGLDQPGVFEHERELWQLMEDSINEAGYKNKVGFQVDIAAGCFFNPKTDRFEGLLSEEDKTKEDLIELYKEAVRDYPLVVLEDPLDEDDYEGHAELTKEIPQILIVGDDLFTTNAKRLQEAIDIGACNGALLKVNQIGTFSEALDYVNLAHMNGYRVMPCSSRGEGEAIADYTVGLNTGVIRESGLGDTGNRLLKIEDELGKNAMFLGKRGLEPVYKKSI